MNIYFIIFLNRLSLIINSIDAEARETRDRIKRVKRACMADRVTKGYDLSLITLRGVGEDALIVISLKYVGCPSCFTSIV